MDNALIADRLDAFATLLELAEANPYSARAYRRAAETIRSAPVSVAELVRAGHVRRLRGIGGSIEAKLRELVETGRDRRAHRARAGARARASSGSAATSASARSGRWSSPARSASPRPRSCARPRPRAGCGTSPASGRRSRRSCSPRWPRGRRGGRSTGIGFSAARELTLAVAAALDGEVAGDARRWVDAPERLAVVCAAADPAPVLARFAELPQVVALLESGGAARGRRDGRGRAARAGGRAARRVRDRAAAGDRRAGVRRGARAAAGRARRGRGRTPRSASPGSRPSCARRRSATRRRRCSRSRTSAATCTATRPGRTAARASRRWPAAAIERGYEYLAICDHTPAVGAVQGLTPDDVRRQAEEIAAANERSRRSACCAGSSATSSRTGRLDLPDDVLAELDWVQAACTAASGCRARR